MRFSRPSRWLAISFTLVLMAVAVGPLSGQSSYSLFGDKDCFGVGGACLEGSTVSFTLVTSSGDPAPTDTWYNEVGIQSWTHFFTPTTVFGAFLSFRTLGIADVAGPYQVFVDGFLVGEMPTDGFGHNLVETFMFALTPAMLADGSATVSFTSVSSDGWAIDYSEISGPDATVPEPATMTLLATGLAGMAAARRKKRRK